ncbi:hypothetical protein ADL00_33910 [Streptomyces sp. AS58]|uniref:hypothetical protein n=1 Tax=Streptomyces sp. AS58 TaxID=1519489 RepID=UPI0006AE17B6|nr:hypothetical protein [Streptomyces sp. AS58]KOV53585.1 hypothetical protein ADL00_33910 [Streptomyces sp. AS58]
MATAKEERLPRATESDGDEAPLVTKCGRRIEVRCLRFGRPDHPVDRIALAVGEDLGGEHGVWAALSPDEARGLARRLLQQADAAERSAARPGTVSS